MKIVVEFNSLEELNQFCTGVLVAPGLAGEVNMASAVVKQEPKKEDTKKRTKAVKEEPVQAETTQEEAQEQTAVTEAEETAVEYTLEDVRAKLGALQKAGHREEVKALLQSVGAEKLPEVDPKDYAVLMQKAGELNA